MYSGNQTIHQFSIKNIVSYFSKELGQIYRTQLVFIVFPLLFQQHTNGRFQVTENSD